jgi:hypothetical protein
MSNEVVVRQDDIPAIADDYLIQIADQAERRIDAVIKIKKVALKVTNARDWTDQQGNPYLQVSGSEKIANLFNISWRIEEPRCEEEPDGHFTYSIKGEFSLGGRTIEVEGTRSSKDGFFKKYDYPKDKPRVELPPSAIDKGDVKKAALTNLFGNGITRILGIRNLTWEDLQEFANITKEQVGSIQYKKEGKYTDIKPPQSKSAPIPSEPGKSAKESFIAELSNHVKGDVAQFKKLMREFTAFGDNKGIDDVAKLTEKWAGSALGKLRKLVAEKATKPEDVQDAESCTKDPLTCGVSMFDEKDKAFCGDNNQTPCKYQTVKEAF